MITVGVAAYNAATVIPKLLDSLLAQDFPWDRMEIVVADNGSIDNTTDVVRRYMSRGPVRLVQAAHRRGPSVARNAVVAAARGEIIAFIDSDCIAHTEWLAEIEAGFADPTVGCVAGSILAAEPKTAVERYYARRGILSQEHVLSHSFLPYAQTANAAFRKEVFDRIGLFDEELITAEDSDVLWRMQLETGFRLCYRPEAVAWHRHRSTTAGLWRQTIGWGIGDAYPVQEVPPASSEGSLEKTPLAIPPDSRACQPLSSSLGCGEAPVEQRGVVGGCLSKPPLQWRATVGPAEGLPCQPGLLPLTAPVSTWWSAKVVCKGSAGRAALPVS